MSEVVNIPTLLERAFLDSTYSYAWSLCYGERLNKSAYMSSWPRSPEQQTLIQQAFGIKPSDQVVTYQDHLKTPRWCPPLDLVKAMIKDAQTAEVNGFLTRAEFIRRQRKIGMTGGMGSAGPVFQTTVMVDPPRGNDNVALIDWYVSAEINWYVDRSITVSTVALERDTDVIHELYMWRGCEHAFTHTVPSNCYHVYKCTKCGHRYDIDSGD